MVLSEYYEILGLPVNASLDEIKKAYRKKARLFHPDINPAPDAMEQFIRVTQAYDFLIHNNEKPADDVDEFNKVMEEWRKYRQERSTSRARYYAHLSYIQFKKSKYYKSTRVLNSATIFFNFFVAVLVLVYTVAGYIYRLMNPLPGIENPSIFSFIILLIFSIILFAVSFLYLKDFLAARKKSDKTHGL